jgi:hypothetical protein
MNLSVPVRVEFGVGRGAVSFEQIVLFVVLFKLLLVLEGGGEGMSVAE